jgi:hypothetical protein
MPQRFFCVFHRKQRLRLLVLWEPLSEDIVGIFLLQVAAVVDVCVGQPYRGVAVS